MVKAIMRQVHGPISRAAGPLCAEWSHLVGNSNSFFLQLDFLNKKLNELNEWLSKISAAGLFPLIPW